MPGHKQLFLIVAMLVIGVGSSPSFAATGGTLLMEYSHYESGKEELNAGNYQEALKHYGTLSERFPKSPYLEQAQLEMAYAHYKLGNSDTAISLLTDFIEKNQRHTHLPYAYYLAGLSQYQYSLNLMKNTQEEQSLENVTQNTQKALDFFSTLVDDFPGSQYTQDAKDKTAHLLEQMILFRVNFEEEATLQTRNARIEEESRRSVDWLMKQPSQRYTL